MRNGEFDGVILDPDNYDDDEINHIEIYRERTRQPDEALAEADHAISRSELGKLMWVARIARPGAHRPPRKRCLRIIDVSEEKEDILGNGEEGFPAREENDFDRIPGFSEFYRGWKGC